MPISKSYFSIPPVNDSSTQTNGDGLSGGFSPNKGNQFVKFSISAQDRMLDTSDMHLTFQIVYVDTTGTPIKMPAATTRAAYSANQGVNLQKTGNINIDNWCGAQSAIKRIFVQSKKSAISISEHRNYPAYVGIRNANTISTEEYIDSPLTRYGAGGSKSGFTNRHTLMMSSASGSSGGDTTNISNINDEQYGQFCSFKLNTALLNNTKALHLGNDYLGGMLVNLELNNENGFFYQRFQDVGTGQVNASIAGSYYIIKNMRLQGRMIVPTPQEVANYQPDMLLDDRISLVNDVQSSVNSSKYTPQISATKGFVNLFLDDDQQNNIAQNQANFRLPLGLRTYQQNKNNIRNPQDFVIDVSPNLMTTTSAAPGATVAFTSSVITDKAAAQGDAEVRANFQRSLLDGRLSDKTSATLALTNKSLSADYANVRGAIAQTDGVGENIHADCMGIGLDLTQGMGNISSFYQRDYDLITRSGVNSGSALLPASRRSKPEVVESYIRCKSAFNTQTLQKSFVL